MIAKQKFMPKNTNEIPDSKEAVVTLPTVLQLLTDLPDKQRQQLRGFARRRWQRLLRLSNNSSRLASHNPDELVNAALAKVLLGDIAPTLGRRLPAAGRRSSQAFKRQLMSIVNSELSNLVRSLVMTQMHLPLGETDEVPGTVVVASPVELSRLLERRDLQRELFVRLRAPKVLTPIIDHWEPQFHTSDGIAQREFDRRQVHQVRRLARRILRDLAREIQPHHPDGREMIL
jgi:hypothetical protein